MDTEKAAVPRAAWRLLVILGLVTALVAAWVNSGDDSEDTSSTYQKPTLRSVQYQLTGSAAGADLTWTDGRGQTTQATGKAVPLTDEDGVPGAIRFSAAAGSFLYFSAQNTGSFGDLTCRIVVDGEVVAENTSSGGYSIVSCNATA